MAITARPPWAGGGGDIRHVGLWIRAAKCGRNLSRLTISGEEFSTSFADAHLQKLICLPILAGAPGRIRTCDLRLRRATLYPAELRVLRARLITHSKVGRKHHTAHFRLGTPHPGKKRVRRDASPGRNWQRRPEDVRPQYRQGLATTTHFANRIAPFLQSHCLFWAL